MVDPLCSTDSWVVADAQPLFRQDTSGQAKSAELEYVATSEDEVEDLFELLARVKREMPEVQAVASGAILSNYQRLRVENVYAPPLRGRAEPH